MNAPTDVSRQRPGPVLKSNHPAIATANQRLRKMTNALDDDPFSRSFSDPDHYQASIRNGDSLFTLLGRGEFRADLTTVVLNNVTLQNGRETLPRLAASC